MNIADLDRYPRCGHGVLKGRIKQSWQDRDSVLSGFGEQEGKARRAYGRYVREGIAVGKRPELVGRGLIRSLGGWSQVLSLRQLNERTLSDERILGTGDFVAAIVEQADESLKHQFRANNLRQKAERIIDEVYKREGISSRQLRMGSRRGRISQARSRIAHPLVEDFGLSLAEVARQLGVSPSTISKVIKRGIGA